MFRPSAFRLGSQPRSHADLSASRAVEHLPAQDGGSAAELWMVLAVGLFVVGVAGFFVEWLVPEPVGGFAARWIGLVLAVALLATRLWQRAVALRPRALGAGVVGRPPADTSASAAAVLVMVLGGLLVVAVLVALTGGAAAADPMLAEPWHQLPERSRSPRTNWAPNLIAAGLVLVAAGVPVPQPQLVRRRRAPAGRAAAVSTRDPS